MIFILDFYFIYIINFRIMFDNINTNAIDVVVRIRDIYIITFAHDFSFCVNNIILTRIIVKMVNHSLDDSIHIFPNVMVLIMSYKIILKTQRYIRILIY